MPKSQGPWSPWHPIWQVRNHVASSTLHLWLWRWVVLNDHLKTPKTPKIPMRYMATALLQEIALAISEKCSIWFMIEMLGKYNPNGDTLPKSRNMGQSISKWFKMIDSQECILFKQWPICPTYPNGPNLCSSLRPLASQIWYASVHLHPLPVLLISQIDAYVPEKWASWVS